MYQFIVKIYRCVPVKRALCMMLRETAFVEGESYKDFKFRGPFKIKDQQYQLKITMNHDEGTIANELFWKGLFNSWESETGWIWIEFAKVSKVVFDIGANVGIYSLVAKSVNSKAQVVAFEPSINTFKGLEKNIKLNKYDIIAEQVALSNTTGTEHFYDVVDRNQTSASLSPNMLSKREGYASIAKEYLVNTIELDKYIVENDIKNIDLIKIDVEMHEPNVLLGFREFIKIFNPIIIIEVLNQEIGKTLDNLIDTDQYIIGNLTGQNSIKLVDKLSNSDCLSWNYVLIPLSRWASIKTNNRITEAFDRLP